jgi:hypothetical protein
MMDLAPSLQAGYRLVDAGELQTLFQNIFGIIGGYVAAGTIQSTGTPLRSGISTYTPSAGNTGVILPPGLPGQEVTVVNGSGTVAGVLYGNGGDQIIPLASATAAGSLAMPAGTTAVLICVAKNPATGVATWKVTSLG